MPMQDRYDTDIPLDAEERVIERHGNHSKRVCEYYLGNDCVGRRDFESDGTLIMEIPLRGGRRHGTVYCWCPFSGELESAEPYVNGLAHGTARQWAEDGSLVGTYEMDQGSGIDFWWHHPFEGEEHFLSEVHHFRSGLPHGWEWWIDEDQRSVHEERHWHAGELHGIERIWGSDGFLEDGYPRFYLGGRVTSREEYDAAATSDGALPPYRESDDNPYRVFPDVVRAKMRGEGDRRSSR
jgi:antitoxin component YwqK of YwqJK toxin-antitoxin module